MDLALGECPPRCGDMWRDRYGDAWFIAGDDELIAVYWTGSRKSLEVLEDHGPLTLVHREPAGG